MHLWTEYEGRTIAGSYTLGKLLRSEGRNAFFATSTSSGSSAVIRLTEAHFDEEEQLKRWHQVAGVHQDNLIEIENVGKTTFDGVALTYALMEPDDANLADVLRERPLTTAETTQVANSVLSALAALHANGLVHEHIEPANVLAVGETVKLRSDCVRECVADVEFNTPEGCAGLRRRDLHDFGLLLLQCLTLEKEWTPTTNLPEPFRRVVPRALDGSWTLEQIAPVIDPATSIGSTPAPAASTATNGAVSPSAGQPLVPPGVRQSPVAATTPATAPEAAPRATPVPSRVDEPAIPLRSRSRTDEADEPATSGPRALWWVYLAAAVLVALIGWHFVGGRPSHRDVPVAPVAAQAGPPLVRPAAPSNSARSIAPAVPTASAAPRAARAAGWYVIAYTYNHQNQAQAKATHVGERHGGFHPVVFSPSGHAPYLVSLGGPMNEREARELQRRARRSGLARDTFIRRY